MSIRAEIPPFTSEEKRVAKQIRAEIIDQFKAIDFRNQRIGIVSNNWREASDRAKDYFLLVARWHLAKLRAIKSK